MVTSDRRGERERSENVHKLSPAATKNADCYRTMTRPVNNMIMRSEYNSKQQSNKPPNLGGSAISEIMAVSGRIWKATSALYASAVINWTWE